MKYAVGKSWLALNLTTLNFSMVIPAPDIGQFLSSPALWTLHQEFHDYRTLASSHYRHFLFWPNTYMHNIMTHFVDLFWCPSSL